MVGASGSPLNRRLEVEFGGKVSISTRQRYSVYLNKQRSLVLNAPQRINTVREYISWQDDFSVGVAVIDEQHKRLLLVINEFLYSLEDKDNRLVIGRSLDEMINYTEYHFYTEQLLLEKHPEFLAHLHQHWLLVKQAKKIQDDFQHHLELRADIFDFLLSWLKSHILGTDKVYFSYLKTNNLL